ncbi:hypothetical protein D1F64_12675 [Breoghania sp. L-A4]|nr:hypothetical protein D1F64_12675 [Breoghania sp. L-A4]
MEKTLGLISGAPTRDGQQCNLLAAERAAIGRIRRLLADLHLPCHCQDEVDTVMAELDHWEGLRFKRKLMREARRSIVQLVAGFEFLNDIARTPVSQFDQDTCRDHAETLRFLAGIAVSAADVLDKIADADPEPD